MTYLKTEIKPYTCIFYVGLPISFEFFFSFARLLTGLFSIWTVNRPKKTENTHIYEIWTKQPWKKSAVNNNTNVIKIQASTIALRIYEKLWQHTEITIFLHICCTRGELTALILFCRNDFWAWFDGPIFDRVRVWACTMHIHLLYDQWHRAKINRNRNCKNKENYKQKKSDNEQNGATATTKPCGGWIFDSMLCVITNIKSMKYEITAD